MEKRQEKIIDVAMKRVKADLLIKNAKYLNVFLNSFEEADIAVSDGYFCAIGNFEGKEEIDANGKYVVPGFMDSHMHLESSIISPLEYAKAVIKHGTTSIFTDPHEIANVLGKEGVDYILNSTKNLPLDVYVMVPSCVPATCFDEPGACLDEEAIGEYLKNDRVLGLAEMMNYTGVINKDKGVLKKIERARKAGKLIDGHAPLLRQNEAEAYISCGITSDHEVTSLDEAKFRISMGQWIMIRQGTACHNLKALYPLLLDENYSLRCMFATDDIHPNDLINKGHIDYIIKLAIDNGVSPVAAYKAASYNTSVYFRQYDKGAIAPGYKADFVILNDLNEVEIDSVYKNGKKITPKDFEGHEEYEAEKKNTVNFLPLTKEAVKDMRRKVIGVVAHEIITTDCGYYDRIDTQNDIVKLCVVERHKNKGHIGVCYLKGYGLKKGAIATTVAHDSHNIIAVGADDDDILFAINRLKEIKGGMVIVEDKLVKKELPLTIAGLMSPLSIKEVKERLDELKEVAHSLGVSCDIDPFMTLSFLSLPVIPEIRLTTFGAFDVNNFKLFGK